MEIGFNTVKRTLSRQLLLLLLAFFCAVGVSSPLSAEFKPSGNLEIHYINVGQGGCTLIIGPDGTRILYDFGKVSGRINIVPYLKNNIGLLPEQGIHYTIVSHRDKDHYAGYGDVVNAGYDVLIANYGSGSPKPSSKTMKKKWLEPAKETKAGPVRSIPVGMKIPLGNGAEAIVMSANGIVHGEEEGIAVKNENDRSVALFIAYGNFQYILDGDLGAGPEKCTQHQTSQIDVQTRIAEALIDQGLMKRDHGVDILHISHHGSESSTSAAYYNLLKPEVGLISVGQKQGTFRHPREDVVDRVLLDTPLRADCVAAKPLKNLFQTEDGVGKDDPGEREIERCSKTGCTSYTGLAIGDIKVIVNDEGYSITGNNRVHGGEKEAPPGKMWTFPFDEDQASHTN